VKVLEECSIAVSRLFLSPAEVIVPQVVPVKADLQDTRSFHELDEGHNEGNNQSNCERRINKEDGSQ